MKQSAAGAVMIGGLVPVLILVPALAQFGMATWRGYEPRLQHAGVFLPVEPTVLDSDWVGIALAGVLVALAFTVLGVAWLMRHRSSELEKRDATPWVFSAFALVGFRWLKTVLNERSSDEAFLSSMWGFDHMTLPYLMLPVCLLAIAALLVFHGRQKTLIPLGIGVVAGALSAVLWLYAIGPVVLP